MFDPRNQKLASLLVNYSIQLRPNEKVLIILYGLEGYPLLKEVYRECVRVGAHCTYEIRDAELSRLFFDNASSDQITQPPAAYKLQQAEDMDAMIQILADRNGSELAEVDQKKMIAQRKANKALSDILHTKRWVLFEYPTAIAAHNAKMSVDKWTDFVHTCCSVDWEKMAEEQEVLKHLLQRTNTIRLVAEGTNLEVGVAGQNWVKCHGKHNVPDGEIFSSPHKNAVNGTILFNTPTRYMGKEFQWIALTFEDGKVVACDSDNVRDLEAILDTDAGARYLGEFAFGTNRYIQHPVHSILFDEKIGGSNHMALGKCYEEAPNGNDSSIHWDLILRHSEANGEVYLDDVLVQKKGIWIHPDLLPFNPA